MTRPVRGVHDEKALDLEPRQGLAQGCAADAEPVGELDLPHAPPGREATSDDLAVQGRVGVVGGRAELAAVERRRALAGPLHPHPPA